MLVLSTQATEVEDLYQSSVNVANQSKQARNTAQKEALKNVFVKVSGKYSVLDNEEIQKAVLNASSYVRRFQFTRDDDNQLMLLVDFDEAKINKLLRNEALPIWGKRRPSILLWLAGEDPQTGRRQVVSNQSYSEYAQQIRKLSEQRGLPLVVPLYDIVDNQKVMVSDVWGYFYSHIAKFSLRYNTDAIVIARFKQDKADPIDELTQTLAQPPEPATEHNKQMSWQLQWRLFEANDVAQTGQETGQVSELLVSLVNNLADRYAKEYAVDSSKVEGGSRIVLTVTNVGDIESLINAEELLMSFSAVSDVLLKSVKQDTAEFEILLLGESLDLLQGLELEKRFEKIFDPLENPQNQPLAFRWKP